MRPLEQNQRSTSDEEPESNDYRALMDIVRGYFNQDWDIETEDPDLIVAQIRREAPPQFLSSLIGDITRFLNKYGSSNAELDEAFERVFAPEIHFYHLKGRTIREGLEKTLEILSSPGSGA